MATFTIDSENKITAHACFPVGAGSCQSFSNHKELASVIADWRMSRLVDTFNSFAGVAPFDDLKPVKKFTDRKVAVTRIWAAIQRLSPDVVAQPSDVAPVEEESKKSSTKGGNSARALNGEKLAKDRSEERINKKAEVLAMIKRAKGAALAEIMKATGWQAHTVRGFISILGSKDGLKIESLRDENKNRRYRAAR